MDGSISVMTKCPSNAGVIEVTEGGGQMTPSAFYALMFNLKVKEGIYNRDFVKCFCGADHYKEMTHHDRYGIDYTLCLCQECGLLYSNPRMTEDSFKQFYENDYRNIYSDRYEISEEKGNERIKKYVENILKEYEQPMPKTVFEIGCGVGTNLIPFIDSECIGVDYDYTAIEKGQAEGLDLRMGGIEVLEASGKKADLIIMHHVLEHMTDLERDLKRIRDLLTETGVLYVSVPGFYTWDKGSLMQNAHNYQFTGNTLNYVMNVCGFCDYELTEQIQSLWYKTEPMDKILKLEDEHRTIESFLTGDKFLFPKLRMNCKFTISERRENIKYAVKTGVKEITPLKDKYIDGKAIIIAGGPSIKDYAEKIKELKAQGGFVVAIDRMYKWCLDRGIIPDYVVVLDASEDVIESFDTIHPDTTHILVAHARPEVFDKVKDEKAYYFHLQQRGIDFTDVYPKDEYKRLTFINSGSSVALCCLSVSMFLGLKEYHVFGFDCHINDSSYAEGIAGKGCITDVIEVEIDGRIFKTTSSFFSFMRQFIELIMLGRELKMINDVKVYGDSMIKAAALIDIDGDKEEV